MPRIMSAGLHVSVLKVACRLRIPPVVGVARLSHANHMTRPLNRKVVQLRLGRTAAMASADEDAATNVSSKSARSQT
jgi:hypothetical protein